MDARPQVNADPNQVVVVDTNKMDWEPTAHRGLSQKVLERVNDPRKGRETALLRFAPGTSLPPEQLSERVDICVIEGSLSVDGAKYGPRSFLRNPPGTTQTLASEEGCTVYMKRRVPIRATDNDRMAIDCDKANWVPFPHRGATVLHLYRDKHGIEVSRIGQVHPHKKIPMHDHAMGEETFVIDGCLKDEYTAYTPGVWFRMPIGVPHTPYTEDGGCLMLIREGDLVW